MPNLAHWLMHHQLIFAWAWHWEMKSLMNGDWKITLRFIKILILTIFKTRLNFHNNHIWSHLAWEVRNNDECAFVNKKVFRIFFSTLKDWNNHVIVKKQWNYIKAFTSKQRHIGEKQFQPDIWDLCPNRSWRGESNFKPKISRKS